MFWPTTSKVRRKLSGLVSDLSFLAQTNQKTISTLNHAIAVAEAEIKECVSARDLALDLAKAIRSVIPAPKQ